MIMDQIRQIGEVLGSLNALMVFKEEIKINKNQCCLLADAFNLAFETVATEIKQNLKFEERNSKWKSLEQPLKELCRIFREGEQYVKNFLDVKDWWAKAIAYNQSNECVEYHIHNLLWCVFLVIEAIENVGEISGSNADEVQKMKMLFTKKYDKEWIDPSLFQLKYGKIYLVSQEMCSRYRRVWREDQWALSEMVAGKGGSSFSRQENWLSEMLVNPRGRMFPTSVLVGSTEYQVRRRLGSGGHYKEVQWMGENFAVQHLFGDLGPLKQELPLLQSFSHPNVMNVMYAFADEEKKECYLVMEMMNKDLASYIKEICSSRRRIPFPLLVAVDVMLQIARGMEYLHSKNVYHGDLNPYNILVKNQNSSPDGYLHVKVAGIRNAVMKNNSNSKLADSCIWYAPEVLSEQDQSADCSSKFSEKADVYSFAMVCFELLTGKVPFEDGHLQGDKMSKNIKAGERPLFPFPSPKYLTSLTKRCWHVDPLLRPSFSSICKVLRYIKKFLVMNPDHSQPDSPMPQFDYFDIDLNLRKRSMWATKENLQISAIPFQMFAYRSIEREKTSMNMKDKSSETGSDEKSICGDENGSVNLVPSEDSLSSSVSSSRSSSQETIKKRSAKKVDTKLTKQSGTKQPSKSVRPQVTSCAHSLRMNSESKLQGRRRTPAPVSDDS